MCFFVCGFAFADATDESDISKRHENRIRKTMPNQNLAGDQSPEGLSASVQSFDEYSVYWLAGELGVDESQLEFKTSVILTRFDQDGNPLWTETKLAVIIFNGTRYFVKGESLLGRFGWSCSKLPQQWGFSGAAMVKAQLMSELNKGDEDLRFMGTTGLGITLMSEDGLSKDFVDMYIYEASFMDENGNIHKRIADWGLNPGSDPWKISEGKALTYLSLFLSGFNPDVQHVATINMTQLGDRDKDTEISVLTYNGKRYYVYGEGYTNISGDGPHDWQDAFQNWVITNLVHPFDARIGACEAKMTMMEKLNMSDEDLIYAGEVTAPDIEKDSLIISQSGDYSHIFKFADKDDPDHFYFITFCFNPNSMTWVQYGEIIEDEADDEKEKEAEQNNDQSPELGEIIAVNNAMQAQQLPEGVSLVGARVDANQYKNKEQY